MTDRELFLCMRDFKGNSRDSWPGIQNSFHFPKIACDAIKPISVRRFFTSCAERNVPPHFLPAGLRRFWQNRRAITEAEIGNDRRPVDSRGIQKPPAGITAGGPRSLVHSRVGAEGEIPRRGGRGEDRKLSFTTGSTTSTQKSAERSEKGADVGGHSLLFINSRRGEMRPLCAVRLLVSPTRSSLCFHPTRMRRTHTRARARDVNTGHRM